MKRLFTILATLVISSALNAAVFEADLSFSADSIVVGDPVTMHIAIEAPAGGQLILPEWSQALAPLELLSPIDTISVVRENNIQRWILEWETTCYSGGNQIIEPIQFRWQPDDNVSADTAFTRPYQIFVQGIVPDSIKALADTTAQPHHLLQPNRSRKLGYSFAEIAPWIAAAIAAVFIFFFIRWLLRRRKRQTEEIQAGPPPRPAHEIALEALDELRDKRLYQEGRIKEYYSALSEIIRIYIEAHFDVPAMESTSFQLLRDIEPRLGNQELYDALGTMLNDADLAKFAKHQPNALTCQKGLERGYSLVEKTKPAPEPLLSGEEAA
ncbi:hypothetical protein CEE37_01305 [candidate division LCP-89 bacterium B3_LCP]|uniref:Protein BatD n=1 Tax=candidate division LCP-89 bacterium B3_LCP TaxID=2012998 RepID=A0A532V5W2_UNCL8|nr:MAG: hypothetical protein CEE37_01305 [candidate division LCP-89 bacterium B3_LCP]